MTSTAITFSSAPSWVLRLRLHTPAFVGGARAREADTVTPLRASSLRGVWRLWFRHALGGVIAHGDGGAVFRKLEAEMFGSVHDKHLVGSRLRVGPPQGGTVRGFGVPTDVGRRYLGYGIFDTKILAEAVETPAGKDITVRVGLRRQGDREKDELRQQVLAATLWLWSNFGGVGARCRRGWGAVEIVDAGGLNLPGCPWAPRFGEVRGLLESLNTGLDAAEAVFRRYARSFGAPLRGSGALPPEVRTLAGIVSLRALPVQYSSATAAHNCVGVLFQDFRSTLRRNANRMPPLPDYFEVKEAIGGRPGAPRGVERAAFGLPLNFFFRSLGGQKLSFMPKPRSGARRRASKVDRLPSPLWLRVHPLANNRWTVLMVDMAEKAGSHLAGCSLESDRGHSPPPPDGKLVKDFLQWAINEARLRGPV